MKVAVLLLNLLGAAAFSPAARVVGLRVADTVAPSALSNSALPPTLGALGGVSVAASIACLTSAAPAAMVIAPSQGSLEIVGSLAFAVALVSVFLHYSAAVEESEDAEACFVDTEEPVCGTLSFDSTPDFACIQIVGKDGNLQWACQ